MLLSKSCPCPFLQWILKLLKRTCISSQFFFFLQNEDENAIRLIGRVSLRRDEWRFLSSLVSVWRRSDDRDVSLGVTARRHPHHPKPDDPDSGPSGKQDQDGRRLLPVLRTTASCRFFKQSGLIFFPFSLISLSSFFLYFFTKNINLKICLKIYLLIL